MTSPKLHYRRLPVKAAAVAGIHHASQKQHTHNESWTGNVMFIHHAMRGATLHVLYEGCARYIIYYYRWRALTSDGGTLHPFPRDSPPSPRSSKSNDQRVCTVNSYGQSNVPAGFTTNTTTTTIDSTVNVLFYSRGREGEGRLTITTLSYTTGRFGENWAKVPVWTTMIMEPPKAILYNSIFFKFLCWL